MSESDKIRVCIQVEAGSTESRRYNEKTLEYRGTRQVSRPYPYPYGFILETDAEDGDNVDCYLITHEKVTAGSIVECKPIGLLEQHEGEEIDHKILAALPGQEEVVNETLLQELQAFIYAIFARFPDINIRVGPLLPQEAALDYLRAHREK